MTRYLDTADHRHFQLSLGFHMCDWSGNVAVAQVTQAGRLICESCKGLLSHETYQVVGSINLRPNGLYVVRPCASSKAAQFIYADTR